MGTFRNRPTSTENYRNPDHQKYVTGDGWKSGESDTDAPGAKSAKGAGKEGVAGLKAETARPPSHGNTGTQSAPEQKTKLGISVVTCKPNAGSMGQIKGGDPHGYLGHFRSPKVLKDGHNQGAPAPFATSGAGDMPPPRTPAVSGGGTTYRPPGAPAPGTPYTPGGGNVSTVSSRAGGQPAERRQTGGGVAAKPVMGAAAPAKNMKQPQKMNISPAQRLKKSVSRVNMARTKLSEAMKGGAKKRTQRTM